MTQVVRKTPEPESASPKLDLNEWRDSVGDVPPHDLQRMIIERLALEHPLSPQPDTAHETRLEQLIAKSSRIGGVLLFAIALLALIATIF
ncbi:hypothetical protein [Sphingobium xenophagum]|uniref:hypothetical protein n=1 Tax=Sphingobium xenophagum TaxID=121428 RepID=UPI001031850B|nr:hypothetical protein [Sphingobium xenophagum]